jgi:hypothetical protein
LPSQQKQWNHLDMADRALAVVPAQDVYGCFYTAMAQFHLSQLAAAESKPLQTIGADNFHRLPQSAVASG